MIHVIVLIGKGGPVSFDYMCLLINPSGPGCRHRHVRRVMCVNYLTGFCPEGPKCKFKQSVNSFHMYIDFILFSLVYSPKFDIPMNAPFIDSARYQLIAAQVKK